MYKKVNYGTKYKLEIWQVSILHISNKQLFSRVTRVQVLHSMHVLHYCKESNIHTSLRNHNRKARSVDTSGAASHLVHSYKFFLSLLFVNMPLPSD